MTRTKNSFTIIYFINLANLVNIGFVDCFNFNFSLEAPPWKVTDLYDDKESSEEDNTKEDFAYYGGSANSNNDEDNNTTVSWFQPARSELSVKYMVLPVSHFDDELTLYWKMACGQNSQFWKLSAPIYLFVRGNRPLKYNELKEGLMFDLANETGGVMFTAEHRYYGQSDPFKNFTYLTSKEAIADLNSLLLEIKKEREYRDSKVVLVGGGYGGSLAVWLKQAHPTAADAVIASSAPLLAKSDLKEYFMHVAKNYQNLVSEDCTEKIKDQLYTFGNCFNDTDVTGCLMEDCSFLNLCDSVDMAVPENRQLFSLSEMSMYSDGAARGVRQMSRICESLEMENRTQIGSMFWDKDNKCFNYDFKRFINGIREKRELGHVHRWFYQCCNEFGYFPNTGGFPPPISSHVPIELYYKICSNLFGLQLNESVINARINSTNEHYGGLAPKVSHVIFVFGELDPWQYVGVPESFSSTIEVLVIPGATHCKDLEPKDRSDTKAVQRGREVIKEFVKKYLDVKNDFNKVFHLE